MEDVLRKNDLERSQRIATEAAKLFNEAQIEVNKERVVAAERVGYFCAGAISLSFTLIGYLFSNTEAKLVLNSNISEFISLLDLLILGWINLSISIVLSLLIRLWNASYINYSNAEYWTSKQRQHEDRVFKSIETGYIPLSIDVSLNDAITNVKNSRDNFEDLEKISSKKASFWLKTINLTQASIYVGSVLGFIFLIYFLIIVNFRLIL